MSREEILDELNKISSDIASLRQDDHARQLDQMVKSIKKRYGIN